MKNQEEENPTLLGRTIIHIALSDPESDEVAHLCFIGHNKKKNEVTYSDSYSKFNASYNELQQALVDMHGDASDEFF